MKILLLSAFPPPYGGVESYSMFLYKNLVRQKTQPFVIAATDAKTRRKNFLTYEAKLQNNIDFLRKIFTINNISKFSIIHSHRPNFDIIGSELKIKHKIPHVITVHIPPEYWLWSKKWYEYHQTSLERCDTIIPVSKSISQNITKKFNIPKSKIEHIPNAVDMQFFKKTKNKPRNKPSILFVGRLIIEKGVLDILTSFSEVVKTIDANLALVGDTPWYDRRLTKETLLKRCKELGIEKKIKFLTNVPFRDMPKIYSNSDILVLPSRQEGMPTTILESLSCGVPVITYDTEGASEIVENGENGILIRNPSSNKLTSVIFRMLSNERVLEKMKNNARKSIKSYDWPIISQKIIDLYTRLI